MPKHLAWVIPGSRFLARLRIHVWQEFTPRKVSVVTEEGNLASMSPGLLDLFRYQTKIGPYISSKTIYK